MARNKFRVECGDGWGALIDPLIEGCKTEGVQIHQIKEKFGGLRFYTDGGESLGLRAAIDRAERQSYRVCEVCGEPGIKRLGGWIKTLCDAHQGETN